MLEARYQQDTDLEITFMKGSPTWKINAGILHHIGSEGR